MKKKLFIIFLTVMASACFALGLSACTGTGGDDPEQGSGDGHTHNISYIAAETATCTHDGHAEYWYCADCGKYFTDAEGNNETTIAQLEIPATGHTPSDPVRENEVSASCAAEGSYDEVVYCEVCDEEISRTSKTIDKTAHSPADPVRENEVPATCTAEGSYDEVVYCEVCDEEISRTSKTIDKLAHTYSDEWSFDDTYHWHAAICCDTGAVSDKAEHTVENGVCTVCGTILAGTEGLEFSLSSDNAYYIVSGIGSAEETDIVTPSIYNGLPVTSIGEDAFRDCTSLESITIPDSVTEIGSFAFYGCTSLESITIPDSVTSISNYAFYGCTSLGSITIPDSVTEIDSSAFEDCSSLTSVTIPESVISIDSRAFWGCSSLTSIIIPDSVTSIGEVAFSFCSSLISITIPDSVTEIGSSAFQGCNSLDSIYYQGDIVSWCGISGLDALIGLGTTLYINGEELSGELVIPNSVTAIPAGAFYDCDLITSIVIPDDVTSIDYSAFRNCSALTSITIPDSVTEIGSSAFRNCSALTSITIPDSVTSIGEGAFEGCSNITTAIMPAIAIDYIPQINLQTVVITSGDSIGDYVFSVCTSLTSITISESVTSIGRYAFNECDSLTSIIIPDRVTSIGSFAFKDCDSLTSIIIPNGVTSIGNGAFSGCTSLESIVVESGNTVYRSSGNCIIETATKKLVVGCKTSEIPNDGSVTSIGDYAFYGCNLITSIAIPDSIISIGRYAFEDCSSFTCITVPDGVTSIGEGAFEGCSNITAATMPAIAIDYIPQNNLQTVVITSGESIGRHAFRYCTSLTSITIPDSVTSIGNGAFEGCYKLIEVYNLSSLNITVGGYDNGYVAYYAKNVYTADSGTSKLSITEDGFILYADSEAKEYYLMGYVGGETEITFLDNIDGNNYAIYDYAFYGRDLITSVTIPDSVISIGDSTFWGCSSLENITIGNGVISIGDSAFDGCSSLKSITIPDSVTSISSSAFLGTNIITATMPAIAIDYIPQVNLQTVVITSGDSIGSRAFYICDTLTSVTLPESVTSIGDSAFYGCSSLKSITIPDGVTSIGGSAFYGCSSLKSIIIPDGVTSIGDSAFAGCSSLESIVVESGNTVYRSSGNCIIETATKTLVVGCKTSEIPNDGSVTSIGDYAFYGCRSLKSITIPDSIISIGSFAFMDCSALTSITTPESVTSIGDSAFYGCRSLESITIPNGVITIGDYMFYNCTSLESIIIPDSVTSIGNVVFNYCYSLYVVYYGGTESDWAAISIGNYNDDLTAATRYYYSETQPTEDGNFWHYAEDGVTPVIWIKETTEP